MSPLSTVEPIRLRVLAHLVLLRIDCLNRVSNRSPFPPPLSPPFPQRTLWILNLSFRSRQIHEDNLVEMEEEGRGAC